MNCGKAGREVLGRIQVSWKNWQIPERKRDRKITTGSLSPPSPNPTLLVPALGLPLTRWWLWVSFELESLRYGGWGAPTVDGGRGLERTRVVD